MALAAWARAQVVAQAAALTANHTAERTEAPSPPPPLSFSDRSLAPSDDESLLHQEHFHSVIYVLVVLMLYGIAISLLLASYGRREADDARYEHIYESFVERKQFERSSHQELVRHVSERFLGIKQQQAESSANAITSIA